MRWEELIGDVEVQFAGELDAQFRDEVADRTRSERATVELGARLVAAKGLSISVLTSSGDRIEGMVVDASAQWVLLGATGRQDLIPVSSIVAVWGASYPTGPMSATTVRLTLGHALRAISRDRSDVSIVTAAGTFAGRIEAVGADACDVSTAAGVVTVPFTAIATVRSSGI